MNVVAVVRRRCHRTRLHEHLRSHMRCLRGHCTLILLFFSLMSLGRFCRAVKDVVSRVLGNPCLVLPCLALPCLALPCLALSFSFSSLSPSFFLYIFASLGRRQGLWLRNGMSLSNMISLFDMLDQIMSSTLQSLTYLWSIHWDQISNISQTGCWTETSPLCSVVNLVTVQLVASICDYLTPPMIKSMKFFKIGFSGPNCLNSILIWVLDWVLDMNNCFKVFASFNILQYLCDFIHVLIFVTVLKCQKNSKLTNIVMIPKLTVNLCAQNVRWLIKALLPRWIGRMYKMYPSSSHLLEAVEILKWFYVDITATMMGCWDQLQKSVCTNPRFHHRPRNLKLLKFPLAIGLADVIDFVHYADGDVTWWLGID